MLHGINSYVLTRANPFINSGIHTLLKHGFDTLTMSDQGHGINRPSIVLEIFEKTAGVEAFSYQWGMLSVIQCRRDLHMSSQKLERK